MAKRIATQLYEEIKAYADKGVNTRALGVEVGFVALARWEKWAKKLNASMRYDGSPAGKRKKGR